MGIDAEFRGQLLDQIKWARYHEGSFSHMDPLLLTQEKLRRMRDGQECEPLNGYDARLLLRAVRASEQHLMGRTVLPETREEVGVLYKRMYRICADKEWE